MTSRRESLTLLCSLFSLLLSLIPIWHHGAKTQLKTPSREGSGDNARATVVNLPSSLSQAWQWWQENDWTSWQNQWVVKKLMSLYSAREQSLTLSCNWVGWCYCSEVDRQPWMVFGSYHADRQSCWDPNFACYCCLCASFEMFSLFSFFFVPNVFVIPIFGLYIHWKSGIIFNNHFVFILPNFCIQNEGTKATLCACIVLLSLFCL